MAFNRGDRGFVAFNLESAAVTVDAATNLAPGIYCDVLSGGLAGGVCTGIEVEVDADGRVLFDLEAESALALHVQAVQ